MKTCHLLRRLLPGLLFLPFIVRAENGLPLNEISTRAYRYFHKTWSAVKDETWYKTDKELIVSFKSNGHLKKAFFNPRGSFLYSIEYYPGIDLSPDVTGMIQKKYPDFQIDAVTQVSNPDRVLYFVHIKNASFIRTISVIEEKVEVYEELINGDPRRD